MYPGWLRARDTRLRWRRLRMASDFASAPHENRINEIVYQPHPLNPPVEMINQPVAFHSLASWKLNPVAFYPRRKIADYFAICILMPREWVREK
jgi:hypothetical protein